MMKLERQNVTSQAAAAVVGYLRLENVTWGHGLPRSSATEFAPCVSLTELGGPTRGHRAVPH